MSKNPDLKTKELIKKARRIAKPYRVTDGASFWLKDIDPGDTYDLKSEDKPRAKEALDLGVKALIDLQDKLYAQDRWSALLIFQAMDGAGKDSAIKHVMSGVNPQGCQVYSFKAPSSEALDHDYLWRCVNSLPERGRIGIFNRSYYEETLVVRVHPKLLCKTEAAKRACQRQYLERPLQRHLQLRALPDTQRHKNPEVLPSCLERGTEATLSCAARQA